MSQTINTSLTSLSGAGTQFENCVQASFVALMLTNGYAPGMPTHPIVKVEFQARRKGIATDDIVVHIKNQTGESAKLFGQIKRNIAVDIFKLEIP